MRLLSASGYGMVKPSVSLLNKVNIAYVFSVLLLLALGHLMPCEWRIVDGTALTIAVPITHHYASTHILSLYKILCFLCMLHTRVYECMNTHISTHTCSHVTCMHTLTHKIKWNFVGWTIFESETNDYSPNGDQHFFPWEFTIGLSNRASKLFILFDCYRQCPSIWHIQRCKSYKKVSRCFFL